MSLFLLLIACGGKSPDTAAQTQTTEQTTTQTTGQSAEIVFEGGTIHVTLGVNGPGQTTDRLAVAGGVVIATGDDVDARIDASTRSIDLAGGVAYPGFTDAHTHLLAGSFVLDRLLLLGTSSMDSLLGKVEDYSEEAPDEPWVVGYGWMSELIDDPSGVALDAVVSDRPVMLVDNSGHSALVNSVAMERAGIDASTPDPADGEIVRDAHGVPTGWLLEGALSLVSEVALDDYTDEQLGAGLPDSMETFSDGGLTGLAEIVASPGFDLSRPWIYEALETDGELPLRIHVYAPIFDVETGVAAAADLRDTMQGERVRFAGAKIWVDGSMGTSLAWMSEALTDGTFGANYFDTDDLTRIVEDAEGLGVPLKLHVNGDAAVAAALDAFEAEAARSGGLTLQHTLDHVVLISETDRARMAELGLVASMQPSHRLASKLGDVVDAWGDDRFEHAYDARALADAGVPLALGTDWPVWPTPDAMIQVWAAAAQLGEARELSVAEALTAYTAGGAQAVGRSADLGALEPGYLADLVVLDADPLELSADEASTINVIAVYVGGEQVR